MLYAFSADFTSYDVLRVPKDLLHFAITCYRSQIVLVGGCYGLFCGETTDHLWVSEAGVHWERSLPPMKIKRQNPSVVSAGYPECLIVAGGVGSSREVLNTVEVLVGNEWLTVQPLPHPPRHLFISNTSLIALDNDREGNDGYWCSVDSLLAPPCDKAQLPCDLWRKFRGPKYYYPSYVLTMATLGQCLVAFPATPDNNGDTIQVLSPSTLTWLDMGEMPWPSLFVASASTILPTGELVMIFEADYKELRDMLKGWTFYVYKASIQCKDVNSASYKVEPFKGAQYIY